MQREANTGQKRDGGESLWSRLVVKMRSDRRLEWVAYALIAVTVIGGYLLLSAEPTRQESALRSADVVANNGADLEARLQEVLSCIRGAGRVSVMITYDTGREIVPAMSTSINSNGSETDDGEKRSSSEQRTESTEPATLSGSGGNSPIVLKEIEPVVRGVIVVADGAADVAVRMDLQRAVRAVLDIPLSQIEVFERSAQPINEGG